MNVPRVSVLMAAYNAMPYLPAAVESILEQTMTDFEFVIVDDGSTDKTPDYLASIEDARVRVITQANGGLAVALNHGLSHCRGESIARMDADDLSLPERLARQVEYLDNHPEIGCVGSQISHFGDVRVGGCLKLPTTHEEIRRALEEGRHAIVHASVMMRAELVKDIGGYWPLRLVSEDHDLFLRLSEKSRIVTISPVLYHVRVHRGSLNGKQMKSVRRGIDFARELAVRRQQDLPPISYEEFARSRDTAPLPRRWLEGLDAFARSNYMAGVGDLYGDHVWRGRLRLAVAAALAPKLTFQRLARMLSPTERA